MFLTRPEIEEMTGKLRRDAQRRVLDAMGVHYGVRPDGSLVVLRDHARDVLGVAMPATPARIAQHQPRVLP